MKKSLLSSILLSAAVVPCALVMTACGGGEQLDQFAQVNTKGAYTTSTQAAMSEYVADENVTDEVATGYHVSMESTGMANMFMNMYVKADAEGNAIESALKIKAQDEEESTEMSIWVKDGVIYMDTLMGGQSLKTKMTLDLGIDAETALLEFGGAGAPVAASDFVETFGEMSGEVGNMIFEVAQTETSVKYHAKNKEAYTITIEGMSAEFEKIEMYLVYENNQFVGATLEGKYTITIEGEEIVSTTKMAITTFSGDITFPNFEEFTLGL